MANYYSDHPEIGFYLNHPLMKRIVELKERNFADAKEYDYAPVDLGDAIENYKQILDITGDVAANIIEPNSEARRSTSRERSYDLCKQDLRESRRHP